MGFSRDPHASIGQELSHPAPQHQARARPAACERLSGNSISASLEGGLQPAQRALIKSEIPAFFSPGLGMARGGNQWKEIMRIRATSRAAAFWLAGGWRPGCAWHGWDNSWEKAVPWLQLSIIRVWDLFNLRAWSGKCHLPLND